VQVNITTRVRSAIHDVTCCGRTCLVPQKSTIATNGSFTQKKARWTIDRSDNSPLTALADRTYTYRQFQNQADWDNSAIEAARLDMPSQLQSVLIQNVKKFQRIRMEIAIWDRHYRSARLDFLLYMTETFIYGYAFAPSQ
jgi:hypothetical protein